MHWAGCLHGPTAGPRWLPEPSVSAGVLGTWPQRFSDPYFITFQVSIIHHSLLSENLEWKSSSSVPRPLSILSPNTSACLFSFFPALPVAFCPFNGERVKPDGWTQCGGKWLQSHLCFPSFLWAHLAPQLYERACLNHLEHLASETRCSQNRPHLFRLPETLG